MELLNIETQRLIIRHLASVNLLKSTGFKHEGHFIENIFFKGIWGSEFQYAILQREWNEKNPNIQLNKY